MVSQSIMVSISCSSPFPLDVPKDGVTALLNVAYTPLILVVAVDRPSVLDEFVLVKGRVSTALLTEGSLAILVWNFRLFDKAITFNTPLHVGREIPSVSPNSFTTGLQPSISPSLAIVIQDEQGVVQRIRHVSMPGLILERLAPLLRQQIAETSRPDLKRTFDKALHRFCRRYRNPSRAFAAATIKASVD